MVPNGVSIVTTTWNERANIEKLIPTIRNTLQQIPHETIVVDDNSSDGTFQTARLLADVAVTKTREGQTKGLLHGMQLAKYPVIITIDADLENDPKHIPTLIQQTAKFDIVIACRTKLPRISEKTKPHYRFRNLRTHSNQVIVVGAKKVSPTTSIKISTVPLLIIFSFWYNSLFVANRTKPN